MFCPCRRVLLCCSYLAFAVQGYLHMTMALFAPHFNAQLRVSRIIELMETQTEPVKLTPPLCGTTQPSEYDRTADAVIGLVTRLPVAVAMVVMIAHIDTHGITAGVVVIST